MKKINIKVSENFLKNENNKKAFEEGGHSSFFESVLTNGMGSKHPQGIPISKGKIFARIQKKLEDLKDSKGEMLELEEAEFDLIKSIFLEDNTTFPIFQITLAAYYVEAIEAAKLD